MSLSLGSGQQFNEKGRLTSLLPGAVSYFHFFLSSANYVAGPVLSRGRGLNFRFPEYLENLLLQDVTKKQVTMITSKSIYFANEVKF